MSPSYWKVSKAKRLARSLKGVAVRERNRLARHAGEPIRTWTLVRRITDEAPRRCRQIICHYVMDRGNGRLINRITVNDADTCFRSLPGALRALTEIA